MAGCCKDGPKTDAARLNQLGPNTATTGARVTTDPHSEMLGWRANARRGVIATAALSLLVHQYVST
jgi:hypothetical protein